jgi:hypothetical protein
LLKLNVYRLRSNSNYPEALFIEYPSTMKAKGKKKLKSTKKQEG